MKQFLKICFAAILVFVLAATSFPADAKKKKDSSGQAKIEFAKDVHDFGVIQEKDGSVSCVFEFTNTGDAVLVIYDATAECGCTRPEYPKNPISPGKKGKIKVTYNPKGRPGSFTKVVTVKSNGKPSKARVKIKGTVK